MTTDELHMLAGYLAASDIDVSPEAVTFDILRPHLQSFYPSHMLDRGLVTRVMRLFLSPADRLEDKIVESCKLACQMREGADLFNLKVLYLQLCWSKPFYGYDAFFILYSIPCLVYASIPCILSALIPHRVNIMTHIVPQVCYVCGSD